MTRVIMFVLLLSLFVPSTAFASEDVVGDVPSPNNFGLLATARDVTTSDLVVALEQEGCSVKTIAITREGKWVIYIPGAPSVVNVGFPQELAQGTAFYVRCGAKPYVYTLQRTDGLDLQYALGFEITINQIRQEHGLPELRHDDRLQEAAELYAIFLNEIFVEGSYKDIPGVEYPIHLQDENPSARARRQGYTGFVAEVIAVSTSWDAASLASPEQSARGSLGSLPHRYVVLDSRYKDLGVGCFQLKYEELDDGRIYLVTMCVVKFG